MKLFQLLKSFSKDKKGSTAIGLGLTFTLVAGATIGAIEIEQMQKTRNIMQDKLDSTILYLGGTDAKTDPQAAGEAYFRSTIEATDLDIVSMTPVFTYEADTGNMIGTVDFEIKSLMSNGFLQQRTMDVRAVATPKTQGDVEISMVLDVSGSMGWAFDSENDAPVGSRRIDGLLEASEAMFNIIAQNPRAVPAVSVVPYASSVDITDLFAAKDSSGRTAGFKDFHSDRSLDNVGMTTQENGDSSFMSLMDLDASDLTTNDRKNTMGVWAAERYATKRGDGTYAINLSKPKAERQIPVYTEEFAQLWTNSNYPSWYGSETIKVRPHNGSWYLGGYERPRMGIMPMTHDIDAVNEYVQSFVPSGGTAAHIGAAWGLYALTPGWQSTFNHPAGAPMKFDETTEKYLVIMTDGQFNSQKDPEMSDDDMYAYFQSVCKKARDKGVRIFTVGLLLDPTTEEELQKCSGTTGAFYPADSRLQLVDAFRSVGRETGELRLSN